jgi:monoterpene epsilon-lactone hydrolase
MLRFQSEVRHLAERSIPVPTADVSFEEQALIAAPYLPFYDRHPKNAAEWKELIVEANEGFVSELSALKANLKVTVKSDKIAGVHVYWIEPQTIPEKNKNRLVVHVHGGGYIFGAEEAGIGEAVLIAGFEGFKVLSIDYRMPPDFPFPAALDDAMAVWKEVVKRVDPKNTALFGTSTGGGLILSMVLRARDEKLPLPAAIAPGTPWADLTETGDSYKTNEWVDNKLVTWSGWLGDAAKLYANGRDLKEPYLSPIYGDFHGFPPAILTTGTRDLFLSNTVRTHRKLRRAGVEADLNVYEGQSHGQFLDDPDAPETKEAMTEIANFFDKHLGK